MHSRNGFLALTGATGLIGHYLLAEVLRSGQCCVALVRHATNGRSRLLRLLNDLDIDGHALLASRRLVLLEADLLGTIESAPDLPITQLVHAAGCTRFHEDSAGDPVRTNVKGTAAILAWAERHSIPSIHLVSTAYVCGRDGGVAAERHCSTPPRFHNAYERSKWLSEQLCLQWAQDDKQRRLTIHRPSIVVGQRSNGRTTTFSGFYLSVRAAEAVAQLAQRRKLDMRHQIQLRIPGRMLGQQNIVPVDDVAKMIAGIVERPELHGRVYHHVHPEPPSNQLIQVAIQEHFNLSGWEFVGNAADDSARNTFERIFDRLIEPIRPYLLDTPQFERANTAHAERILGLRCEPFDQESIQRLCAFATRRGWEAAVQGNAVTTDPSEFFEEFLPKKLPHSKVARMAAVSATVRFVITDAPNAEWVCCFDRGKLAHMHRGCNGVREDFGYRVDRHTFLEAVSGRLDPQHAFLNGKAQLYGNIEQALKMAMVLHLFMQEFPFESRSSDRSQDPADA
jgi:nucleoside-diphosphate-sugar epimerase